MIEVDGVPLTDVSVDLLVSRALFDDTALAATEPWKHAALWSARRKAAKAGQTLAGETPRFQSLRFVTIDDDGTPRSCASEQATAALYRATWACEPPS